MLYSAVTGKIVSELIVDGKSTLPIDAFSVDRFTKGSR
jgi:glycine/D-amino acid oxidase-like deaminating enzyme